MHLYLGGLLNRSQNGEQTEWLTLQREAFWLKTFSDLLRARAERTRNDCYLLNLLHPLLSLRVDYWTPFYSACRVLSTRLLNFTIHTSNTHTRSSLSLSLPLLDFLSSLSGTWKALTEALSQTAPVLKRLSLSSACHPALHWFGLNCDGSLYKSMRIKRAGFWVAGKRVWEEEKDFCFFCTLSTWLYSTRDPFRFSFFTGFYSWIFIRSKVLLISNLNRPVHIADSE